MSLARSAAGAQSIAIQSREVARIGAEVSEEAALYVRDNWESVESAMSTISQASFEASVEVGALVGSVAEQDVVAAIVVLRSLAEKAGMYQECNQEARRRSVLEFQRTGLDTVDNISEARKKTRMTLIYAKHFAECLAERGASPRGDFQAGI